MILIYKSQFEILFILYENNKFTSCTLKMSTGRN